MSAAISPAVGRRSGGSSGDSPKPGMSTAMQSWWSARKGSTGLPHAAVGAQGVDEHERRAFSRCGGIAEQGPCVAYHPAHSDEWI